MLGFTKADQTKKRTTKKNSPKKSTLKKKAWAAFSKFIRLRDCLLSTGTTEKGICITCKKLYDYNMLQAGHFIPGRNNMILFDERQVHGQCQVCNICQRGNFPPYFQAMVDLFGLQEVQKMIETARGIKKYSAKDYEEIATRYNTYSVNLTTYAATSPSHQELIAYIVSQRYKQANIPDSVPATNNIDVSIIPDKPQA